MQDLTEKNTQLSQELEECKAQLEASLAAVGEAKWTLRESSTRGCPDSRTIIIGRTPRL